MQLAKKFSHEKVNDTISNLWDKGNAKRFVRYEIVLELLKMLQFVAFFCFRPFLVAKCRTEFEARMSAQTLRNDELDMCN